MRRLLKCFRESDLWVLGSALLLLGIGAFRVACVGNALPGDRPSPVVSPVLGRTLVARATVTPASSPESGADGIPEVSAEVILRASSVPSATTSPTVSSPTLASPVPTAERVESEFSPPSTEEPVEPNRQDDPLSPTLIPTPQATEFPFVAEPTTETVERAAPATRLVIPALGIDAPIVEVPIANKTWNVSLVEHEIAHLGGTAHPGEKNNMVLAGHATLKRGIGPFFRLESLQPGDIAVVYAGEQPFRYRVLGKRYVLPTEVSVAQPTVDAILTLVTCSNWDAEDRTYRERVAVIAELVSDEMP